MLYIAAMAVQIMLKERETKQIVLFTFWELFRKSVTQFVPLDSDEPLAPFWAILPCDLVEISAEISGRWKIGAKNARVYVSLLLTTALREPYAEVMMNKDSNNHQVL